MKGIQKKTYKQLRSTVARYAAAMRKMGVQEGDRVVGMIQCFSQSCHGYRDLLPRLLRFVSISLCCVMVTAIYFCFFLLCCGYCNSLSWSPQFVSVFLDKFSFWMWFTIRTGTIDRCMSIFCLSLFFTRGIAWQFAENHSPSSLLLLRVMSILSNFKIVPIFLIWSFSMFSVWTINILDCVNIKQGQNFPGIN